MLRPTTWFCMMMLVVACLFTGGCIKVKKDLLLMPDGSGRIDFTLAMNTAMLQQMGADPDENPFDEMYSEMQQTPGIVAFTEGKREEKDGWSYMTFSAYFEDINQVKLGDTPEEATTFAYQTADDASSLTIKQGLVHAMAKDMADDEDVDQQQMAMMMMMMQGLEVSESYQLPGQVSDGGAYDAEARKATAGLTAADLTGGEKAKKYAAAKENVIKFGKSEVTAEQIAAFKKELTEAKEAWEKKKAEAAGG